jgi:hypothetical protein
MRTGHSLQRIGLPVRFLVVCWLLVGTLDIASAFADYYLSKRKNPLIVLRFIAEGLFGKAALTEGNIMYVWGLWLHYLITFCFTIFFYFVFTRLRLNRRNPFLVAACYGIFIYLVMNFTVLPIVFQTPWKFRGLASIKAVIILIMAIALPLTFLMRRYQKRRQFYVETGGKLRAITDHN